MSRTRQDTKHRRRRLAWACWKDCMVCYRRLGITMGEARDRLQRLRLKRKESTY